MYHFFLQLDVVQYLYHTFKTMNNFSNYGNVFLPFWVVPNCYDPTYTFYSSVPYYPQILLPQQTNLPIQNIPPISNSSLPTEQPRSEEKSQPKPLIAAVTQKQEAEKITVQPETNISKQSALKNELKKANRPQTYLTQKAFYMKQKLKGKQKNGMRILRRRLKNHQSKSNKISQGEKKGKKQTEPENQIKKKMPIIKDSERQRKIIMKIKSKLSRQYLNQFASIPTLISGVRELNEFCRVKQESLMSRKVNQAK